MEFRSMNRILITGGSGRLGSAIQRVCREAEIPCYAPSSTELDVLVQDFRDWWSREICDFTPTVMIHCAGYANAWKAESNRAECWRLNVEGTRNMVRAAAGRRFVHISTDYVFDGVEGNYSEDDLPNPVNFYGASKLAAEMIVSEHSNTLMLRAPFRADPPWRFPEAFTDQWTSCRFRVSGGSGRGCGRTLGRDWNLTHRRAAALDSSTGDSRDAGNAQDQARRLQGAPYSARHIAQF
jgi:FlaA1/EpsC-like NDP-sugar epimerase